jgi:AmiR/NasT family two-component response regulator
VGGRPQRLTVLVAEGTFERLEEVVRTVSDLGHHVLQETDLDRIGEVTARERPDVAMVILGESSEHTLQVIGRIVHEAACPVIAVLDVEDRSFIQEAAKRGIFAYVTSGGVDPQELQSAIDVVLRRFAEFHELEGAFSRRAITERAKGILMERHGVDEKHAFGMLRDRARATNRKVVEVAEAVLATHILLPGPKPPVEAPTPEPEPL